MKINISETEFGYVVAVDHIWIPGAYESREVAEYAVSLFSDEELQRLQDSINPGGVITMEMLRQLRIEKS